MAFKASNVVPQEAYRIVKQAAVNLKANLQTANATMAAGVVGVPYLRALYERLADTNAQFDALKTTPGLAAYAQAQEDDPAYDVVAEFTAMQTAIVAALAWMDTNEPAQVSIEDFEVTTTFSPGATAGLRSELAAVIATID